MGEEHRAEVVPRLVVAEHEQRHHDGAAQHQQGQKSAGGAGNLQPHRGLPATEVGHVVQEETGQGHKVDACPGALVFVDRLDARGHGGEHRDGDAEDVEDAQAEHPRLPEDGPQRRDGDRCALLLLVYHHS